MPGVPKFRGCDACHRQKKKCDQSSPPCARCARLRIPCTGKGQLRYKFKEQYVTFAPTQTPRPKSSSPKSLPPPSSPNNQITRLSGRFASALQIDDPQFDLKCFGDWFARIPTRMGACQVLDNATEAFLDAFDDLRSGQPTRTTNPKTPPNHHKALKSLTIALQDPQQAKSPYTLCSIFMIMIAEMWVSKSAQGYMSYMEGICSMLNSTINEPWNDSFAESLRYHLIIPACIEAMLNPNITIDGRYLRILKTTVGPYQALDEEKGQPIESLDLPYLMRFPYFIREPELYHNQMMHDYMRMQIECPFLRRRLMDLTNMAKATRKKKPALVRAQIQMGVAYTMMLSFTLVINAFLSAMDPINITLQEEALHYSQEAIWITRISSRQLPIGAGFMPAALFSAWVATDDSEVISSIESTMKQCKSYWAEPHYVKQFTTMKERVRVIRDRKLVELRNSGLQGMDVTDFTTSDGMEYTWGLLRDKRLGELRGGGLQDIDVTDFTPSDGMEYTSGLLRDKRLGELRGGGLQDIDVTDFTPSDGMEYTSGLEPLVLNPESLYNEVNWAPVSEPSCVREQAQLELYNWDPNLLQ